MIDTKLNGSPEMNSKKVYGMLGDSGNPQDVGNLSIMTDKENGKKV
jgi:hypothetical protein